MAEPSRKSKNEILPGSQEETPVLESLFKYSDYRQYLKDYYQFAKSSKRQFSFRIFARNCGFRSPNFLMLVMQGKSRLSSVSVEKVILGLKLNKEEAHFFRHLVAYTEAKSPTVRRQHAQELLRSRTFRELHPLSEAQYAYLATWYLPVIRSVIGLSSASQEPEWIAKKLQPNLSPDEVKSALQTLLTLGLIYQDENGHFVQSSSTVTTPSEVMSNFAAHYHQQMLDRAKESIDRFKREQRHLAGMTVALNEESLLKVKELTERFRNEVMELAMRSTDSKNIFQVNLQVFPLFLGALIDDEREDQ